MKAFTFSPQAQRFRDAKTGRFVSPSYVRDAVDDDISETKDRMQNLAEELQAGEITTDEFHALMGEEIKKIHLAEVALSRGGRERMEPSDYGRAGGALQYQYKALQGLIDDINANPDIIHGMAGRMDFVERVEMYADAARSTYAASKDEEMRNAGFLARSNKLEEGAHHCSGENSCTAMTALGRVDINDRRYVLEGKRKCITKCKCETQYWKAAA